MKETVVTVTQRNPLLAGCAPHPVPDHVSLI
jgi:hypothetical protein